VEFIVKQSALVDKEVEFIVIKSVFVVIKSAFVVKYIALVYK
jgi:hypothetical protein